MGAPQGLFSGKKRPLGSEMRQERDEFLLVVDGEWQSVLRKALPGDWPTAVLSPHLGVDRLVQAVRFGAALVKKLRACGAQQSRKT